MPENLNNIKIAGALGGGMILQYLFGIKTGWRAVMIILISAPFLAYFVVVPLMSHFGLSNESPLRIMIIALSALVSEVVIGTTIQLLPKAAKKRAEALLGVSANDDPTEK